MYNKRYAISTSTEIYNIYIERALKSFYGISLQALVKCIGLLYQVLGLLCECRKRKKHFCSQVVLCICTMQRASSRKTHSLSKSSAQKIFEFQINYNCIFFIFYCPLCQLAYFFNIMMYFQTILQLMNFSELIITKNLKSYFPQILSKFSKQGTHSLKGNQTLNKVIGSISFFSTFWVFYYVAFLFIYIGPKKLNSTGQYSTFIPKEDIDIFILV